jgi:hypothetical protein
VRIGTAKALRSIDRWKERLVSRYHRYLAGVTLLALSLPGSRRALPVVLALILGISVHFAAVQFGLLLILGISSLRLYSYRFANTLLRLWRV